MTTLTEAGTGLFDLPTEVADVQTWAHDFAATYIRPAAGAREKRKVRVAAAMAAFEATRPSIAAMAVGVVRAAYEYALDYAKTRVQFGRPVIANQGVAFMLADMATEIDAARLLAWRASHQLARGIPLRHAEGSMAKLKASEVPSAPPNKPSKSWAATATPATTPLNAGPATPRSSPSTKAPAKSSASSSAAPFPACASNDTSYPTKPTSTQKGTSTSCPWSP